MYGVQCKMLFILGSDQKMFDSYGQKIKTNE